MARSKSIRPPIAWASIHQQIEAQRRQLQRASAVLTGAVLAVEQNIDRDVVSDAVTAGRQLVDAAIVALDSFNLRGAA